jgi:Fe-S cluster assembly protein SufD
MHGLAAKNLDFLAPFSSLESELARREPEWLRNLRRSALERFAETGLPTTRDEEWRTTSVKPIANARFRPAAGRAVAESDLPRFAREDREAYRLVFVDGRVAESLGSPGPAPGGVWVGNLAQALERDAERVREHLTRRDPAEPTAFAALNTAFNEDGGVVLIDDGASLDRPIHLVYCSTGSDDPDQATASHPRTLIAAGRSSQAEIVESYLGRNGGLYLTNAATDVSLAERSELRHYRIQMESDGGFHVCAVHCTQGRDSRYFGLSLDLGGRLVRRDLLAALAGEGANCELDGLYLTRGAQHVDNHTTIDHQQPRCYSREVYKGVLGGDSRAVFRGRIVVRPGAQQTNAEQSNPNLLLSDAALVHTRPQLEIYADDVKCTHGATVGRLDDTAIFYLRSRAIPLEQARELLVSAFADEVLDLVRSESLRQRLKAVVTARMPAMKG